MMDCTAEYGNNGCRGGWPWAAFQWLKDNDGYTTEEDYPYKARMDRCAHESHCRLGKVEDYRMIPRLDENALLHAVATVGPVIIAFNASPRPCAFYKSGIIDVPGCPTHRNHAVLTVGYGTENGTDYWILKNSWGADWGEDGYFKMKRGVNMCGIAEEAIYPLVG